MNQYANKVFFSLQAKDDVKVPSDCGHGKVKKQLLPYQKWPKEASLIMMNTGKLNNEFKFRVNGTFEVEPEFTKRGTFCSLSLKMYELIGPRLEI